MNQRKETESDYDAEQEELREEVGELPPRIEDLQVVEFDDEDDFLRFGRGKRQSPFDDDEEGANEAPTVVIDSSLDEKDVQTYKNIPDLPPSASLNPNIEFALRSIKLQEEEEETIAKKKKVTIMSVEEEKDLID